MDLVVCPHCFTRVIPMEDQACPRCRGRVDRASEFAPVTVRSGTRLPMYCVACDAPTDALRTWTQSTVPRSWFPFWLRGPVSMLMRAHEVSRAFVVSVELSTCKDCRLPAEPQPQFEEGLVDLLVHRDFARRLRPE